MVTFTELNREPDGTFESLEATDTITDASGTDHSGTLADDGDSQPPENHNNTKHTESYTTTSENVENFATGGADGEVPIASGGSLSMGSVGGGFDQVSVFKSDGSFDASNVDTAFVEVVGGGGGGGGQSGSSSDIFIAGCGGGGGYAAAYCDLSGTSSVSVTVGAGGSGGTTSDGADGSNSSFGTLVEASGGTGGASPGTSDDPVSGGIGTTGDILLRGGDGSGVNLIIGQSQSIVTSGTSGGSVFGDGVGPFFVEDGSGASGSNAGDAIGVGGTGCVINNNSTDRSGGDGGDGIVIVHYNN